MVAIDQLDVLSGAIEMACTKSTKDKDRGSRGQLGKEGGNGPISITHELQRRNQI